MSLSISLVTPWAAETVLGWRSPAISSTSSMNRSTLSSSATSVNDSRRAAASPAGESPARREGNSSTNGQPSLAATPLAKVVLPVPGGPNSTTARGGTRPSRPASSGWASGRITLRSISSFSLTIPSSSSQIPARSRRPPSWPRMPTFSGPTGSSFS
jgi:hypothetical protein